VPFCWLPSPAHIPTSMDLLEAACGLVYWSATLSSSDMEGCALKTLTYYRHVRSFCLILVVLSSKVLGVHSFAS